MKYTVLLLYPDYISDGTETYLAHVEANSATEARDAARRQCVADGELDLENFYDLACLFVAHGHHDDLGAA